MVPKTTLSFEQPHKPIHPRMLSISPHLRPEKTWAKMPHVAQVLRGQVSSD